MSASTLARWAGIVALSVAPLVARTTQERPDGRVTAPSDPVSLSALVPASSPLAAHDLLFDARFADVAVRGAGSGDERWLDRLAELPAAAHLLRHARQFEYDVPRESARALVQDLVRPRQGDEARVATCRESLQFFAGPLLADPGWVADVLAALPAGFRFRGAALYLTCGYDIGVALPPSASLNGAHRTFAGRPRELLYYAIHELHHVGFMSRQPPSRIADLKTCDDIVRFVDYATELEGMAVHAAAGRRAREGALGADADYVALGSAVAMEAIERSYDEIRAALERRGGEPADAAAMKALERMSSERLWYRVGGRMAAVIDTRLGRAALVGLVEKGPAAFRAEYRRLQAQAWAPGRREGGPPRTEQVDAAR